VNIVEQFLKDNYPICKCGKTHDDSQYGHYDYWHCNCPHDEVVVDEEFEDEGMCPSCGKVFSVTYD